jgi:hypothetical protein
MNIYHAAESFNVNANCFIPEAWCFASDNGFEWRFESEEEAIESYIEHYGSAAA